MITNTINPYMESVTTQNTTFNNEVHAKDLEGNVKVVCKVYVTIVANKSISTYIDVVDRDLLEKDREGIQIEIDKHLCTAKEIAKSLGVPTVF